MYTLSGSYYDTLHSFKNYAKETARVREWIRQYNPGARSVLDVACGTGRHLEYLQVDFEVAGIDLNEEMLHAARRRCPDGDFRLGNMVDFTLGRQFDVVTCLFSAIAYTKFLVCMKRAIMNMARHLAPGGVLILEPWFSPDRYYVNHLKVNVTETPGMKTVWMYTTHRDGAIGWWDIHYLIGRPDGVEHFVEHHEVGLFTDEEYRQGFHAAGLSVDYDAYGLIDRGMYFGRRPQEFQSCRPDPAH